MSKLPWDLIIQILCRLPINSLLRFKFVSKPCFSLMDDPYFSDLNLKHSTKPDSDLNLVLFDGMSNKIYSVKLVSLDKIVQLNHPFKNTKAYVNLIGCSNGLIALHYYEYKISCKVVLWNPLTNKYKILNGFKGQFPASFSGFGYDSANNDYKLITKIEPIDKSNPQVAIHSLKSNSWRSYYFKYHSPSIIGTGILVRGYLHWVAGEDKGLIAFDLTSEEFFMVPNPEEIKDDFGLQGFFVTVMEWKGSLCICCNYNGGIISRFEFWLLKEYGVKESWTKLCSFDSRIKCHGSHIKPLAFSTSGDKVLVIRDSTCNCREFLLFDLERQIVDKIDIVTNKGLKLTNGIICRSSLVSPIAIAGRLTE